MQVDPRASMPGFLESHVSKRRDGGEPVGLGWAQMRATRLNHVAPLSRAAVVQVSRPAPPAPGSLEAASTAGLETGATICG
jgi:hypothetical protein